MDLQPGQLFADIAAVGQQPPGQTLRINWTPFRDLSGVRPGGSENLLRAGRIAPFALPLATRGVVLAHLLAIPPPPRSRNCLAR
jgi:hypothetical protein